MTALESAFHGLALAPNPELYAPPLHLLDFPHELLSSILENLSSASDRKSLSICARLCKRFQSPSQEQLFALWTPNTASETDTIESLKNLSTILDHSPHLGRYIRSFWLFLGGLSGSLYYPTSTLYFGHGHRPSCSLGDPSITANAYLYMAKILPRLTNLRSLAVKPLGYETATVNWNSHVDVPNEIRHALGKVLRGSNLNRVSIESVDGFDLGVFREVERINTLELYGTTLATEQYSATNFAPQSTSLDHRCRLDSVTYYLGPGNSPSAFVDYCLDSQRSALSFNSLTHLHLRDPADRSGPSPLTALLQHCSSTLLHLELLYNTEIDSRWEPPNLSSLTYLESLRLTLWLSPSFLRFPEITHEDRCQQVLRLLNTVKPDAPVILGYQPSDPPAVPLSTLTLALSFNVRHRIEVAEDLLSKHKWEHLDDGLASLKKDGLEGLKEVEMIYKAKVTKDMTWKREGEQATLPKVTKLGVDVSLSMESLY